MFDARNKGQPKLVYARVPQSEALKSDQQPAPTSTNSPTPLSKPKDLQATQPKANNSLGGINRNEGQRQLSVLNNMQKDKEQQSMSSQQSAHVQKQQQQHVEMRQKTQQHQPNITVLDVVATKKQKATKGVELYKIAVSDTGGAHTPMENIKHDSYGEVKVHTSKAYEGLNEKRLVNEKLQTSSTSSAQAANSEKKYVVLPAGMRPESAKHMSISDSNNASSSRPNSAKHMSTGDSNNANFLRHPRLHTDSSVTPNRPQLSPQSPNQHLAPQQFMYYQHHLPPKQHPEKPVDVPSSQHQDRRLRPEVVRVRSYSSGRQPMPTTLQSASYKSANPGQTWSIPRVSTAPRPHSLNVPSTRPPDNAGSKSPTAHLEFSSYDPSASPRALRSHGRPHNETTTRQLSAPSSSSSSNSSYNPPKSILKATASQEPPDVFFSSRPLLLPRAHSEKSNTYAPHFDFSSILATNNDILSGKVPTIQITSHTPDQKTSGNPRQPLQRPLSAGAGITNQDLQQDGRPIRKSVTFNSLVRLHHHEDYPPTGRSLSADA